MYERAMVETLSGIFFFGGGGGWGNVYNVVLHVIAATLRGLTYFICVLYNAVLENHSVQNSPWGRGSIASPRPKWELQILLKQSEMQRNTDLMM